MFGLTEGQSGSLDLTYANMCIMRTTVDIPDDLYRVAKARAALDGVRLSDLIEEGLRRVLDGSATPDSSRRVVFPLHRSREPGALSIKNVLDAEIEAERSESSGELATQASRKSFRTRRRHGF